MNGRYDVKRLAVVLACALLVSGMVAFGIPNTSYDGEVEEAEACGGLCVGSAVVLSAVAFGSGVALNEYLSPDETVTAEDTTKDTLEAGYIALDESRVNTENINASTQNYRGYATSPLMSEAKVEMVEEYNNGSSVSQMELEGKQVLLDEVSSQQIRITKAHEGIAKTVRNLAEVYNETDAYEGGDPDLKLEADLSVTNGPENILDHPDNKLLNGSDSQNVTLANGSTHSITTYQFNWRSTGSREELTFDDQTEIWHPSIDIDNDGNDEYEEKKMYDAAVLTNEFDRLNNKSDTLANNLGQIAQDISNNYQRGELNTSDVISPYEQASFYASEWESTGSQKYAKAFKEQIGLNPAENATFDITLEDGTSLSGDLYTDALGTVSTGQTYYYGPDVNTSAVDGSRVWNATEPMFITTSNGDYGIEQNFTVDEMTNPETGDTVSSTSFRELNWESTNVSQLDEELNQLQKLEERYDDLTGGGFGLFGGDGSGPLGVPWVAWILGGGIVLVAFAGRD